MKTLEESAADFSQDCRFAANWKDNYFGAAYSTRIEKAIKDLEQGIADMKAALAADRGDK